MNSLAYVAYERAKEKKVLQFQSGFGLSIIILKPTQLHWTVYWVNFSGN